MTHNLPHTVEIISDPNEAVQNILARIARRTSGDGSYPKFEDLVRDQIAWCEANVVRGWSYDNEAYCWMCAAWTNCWPTPARSFPISRSSSTGHRVVSFFSPKPTGLSEWPGASLPTPSQSSLRPSSSWSKSGRSFGSITTGRSKRGRRANERRVSPHRPLGREH